MRAWRDEHRAICHITTANSRLAVWVIPTDEEQLIARDTCRLVEARS